MFWCNRGREKYLGTGRRDEWVTLEDLAVESIGIPKVRTLLADVQVRILHDGPLAKLIICCMQLLNLR